MLSNITIAAKEIFDTYKQRADIKPSLTYSKIYWERTAAIRRMRIPLKHGLL
jgi:hypothetical protein